MFFTIVLTFLLLTSVSFAGIDPGELSDTEYEQLEEYFLENIYDNPEKYELYTAEQYDELYNQCQLYKEHYHPTKDDKKYIYIIIGEFLAIVFLGFKLSDKR